MQIDPSISVKQRYWWRIALELRLRKCNGNAFQNFFSTVMAQLHGDDFVRVRPFGKLGDKGCDDYQVDPIRHLIPLCATCHHVVHRRNPPYSVAEISVVVAAQSARNLSGTGQRPDSARPRSPDAP